MTNQGQTPLILACENGKLDVAQLLVNRGADPAPKDEQGRRAFDWLERQGQHDFAVQLGAIVRQRDFDKEVEAALTVWKSQHSFKIDNNSNNTTVDSHSAAAVAAIERVRLAGKGEIKVR